MIFLNRIDLNMFLAYIGNTEDDIIPLPSWNPPNATSALYWGSGRLRIGGGGKGISKAGCLGVGGGRNQTQNSCLQWIFELGLHIFTIFSLSTEVEITMKRSSSWLLASSRVTSVWGTQLPLKLRWRCRGAYFLMKSSFCSCVTSKVVEKNPKINKFSLFAASYNWPAGPPSG